MLLNEINIKNRVTNYRNGLLVPLNSDENKKNTSKSSNLLLILLYIVLISLLFSTIVYTKKTVDKINQKKNTILKLNKAYDNILIENEKIKILINELKTNNNPENKKLIKIISNSFFKEKSKQIKKNYNNYQNFNHKKSYFIYYLIIGMILIGIFRFVYLEFDNENKKKFINFPYNDKPF